MCKFCFLVIFGLSTLGVFGQKPDPSKGGENDSTSVKTVPQLVQNMLVRIKRLEEAQKQDSCCVLLKLQFDSLVSALETRPVATDSTKFIDAYLKLQRQNTWEKKHQ